MKKIIWLVFISVTLGLFIISCESSTAIDEKLISQTEILNKEPGNSNIYQYDLNGYGTDAYGKITFRVSNDEETLFYIITANNLIPGDEYKLVTWIEKPNGIFIIPLKPSPVGIANSGGKLQMHGDHGNFLRYNSEYVRRLALDHSEMLIVLLSDPI